MELNMDTLTKTEQSLYNIMKNGERIAESLEKISITLEKQNWNFGAISKNFKEHEEQHCH